MGQRAVGESNVAGMKGRVRGEVAEGLTLH
jgi:hypothetical protein